MIAHGGGWTMAMTQLDFPESGNRRKSLRSLMGRELTARGLAGNSFRMSIINISRGGFRASSDQVLPPGTLMNVTLPNGRSRSARITRVNDGMVAAEFLHRLDPADLTLEGE